MSVFVALVGYHIKVEGSCAYNTSTLLSYIYNGRLAAKWMKRMFRNCRYRVYY